MTLYRMGRLVMCTCWGGNPWDISNLCTIPSGYKPSVSSGVLIEGQSSEYRIPVLAFPSLSSDGNIRIVFEFHSKTAVSNTIITYGTNISARSSYLNVWGGITWITNDNFPSEESTNIYIG